MLHGNLPAVYFYSARVRRSRGASWSSFSPALTATFKHKVGAITNNQRLEILDKVRLSHFAEFKPLLYTIPFPLVRGIIRPVPIKHRANPLADEFIIEGLPRSSFD